MTDTTYEIRLNPQRLYGGDIVLNHDPDHFGMGVVKETTFQEEGSTEVVVVVPMRVGSNNSTEFREETWSIATIEKAPSFMREGFLRGLADTNLPTDLAENLGYEAVRWETNQQASVRRTAFEVRVARLDPTVRMDELLAIISEDGNVSALALCQNTVDSEDDIADEIAGHLVGFEDDLGDVVGEEAARSSMDSLVRFTALLHKAALLHKDARFDAAAPTSGALRRMPKPE